MEKKEIKTRDEAIWYAIEWQRWVSNQSLSIGELIEWQEFFEELAGKFDLVDEFRENLII